MNKLIIDMNKRSVDVKELTPDEQAKEAQKDIDFTSEQSRKASRKASLETKLATKGFTSDELKELKEYLTEHA